MPWVRCFLALFGLLVTWAMASAQPPDPLFGSTTTSQQPPDSLLNPSPLPTANVEPDDRWRLAFDLGLPIGIRLQRRIGDTNFWGEAGLGTWAIAPYVSVCLRYDLTPLRGQRNLFAVRPGISTTGVLLGPYPAVGIDCEFI